MKGKGRKDREEEKEAEKEGREETSVTHMPRCQQLQRKRIQEQTRLNPVIEEIC